MALTGVPPAIFMRDGNPDDPRARRTRALLLNAYESEIEAGRAVVSVATLVRAAGVSRSSFYSHFSGVDELGLAAMRALLEGLEIPADSVSTGGECDPLCSNPSASLLDLFTHLADHRALFVALMADEGGSTPAGAEFRILLTGHIADAIRDSAIPTGVSVDAVATYLVGGLVALMCHLMRDVESAEVDMARHVNSLVPDWLRSCEHLDRPLRLTKRS